LSLADVAFAMVGNLGYFAQAQLLGQDLPPLGNDMYGAFGCDFPPREGRVMVEATSLRQWETLVKATDIALYLPAIKKALRVDLSRRRPFLSPPKPWSCYTTRAPRTMERPQRSLSTPR
jgi:2-methylfumaryl-CoA isomerase